MSGLFALTADLPTGDVHTAVTADVVQDQSFTSRAAISPRVVQLTIIWRIIALEGICLVVKRTLTLVGYRSLVLLNCYYFSFM